MSRYPPADYRGGPRNRSRSPPRFADRRPSGQWQPGPANNNSSDAPRGPRSQPHFDGQRPPPGPGQNAGPSGAGRPPFSLRDAPPLGSGDRGRSFRDRDYDRRDRVLSPRDRSPPRNFNNARDLPPRDLLARDLPPRDLPPRDLPRDLPPRDLPPRDLPPRDVPARELPPRDLPRDLPPRDAPPRDFPPRDAQPRDFPLRDLSVNRARRGSRDGPPATGFGFSDIQGFSSAPSFRGGFGRGRGRGDGDFRGGRGGWRNADDRDMPRRERSPPPPRWERDGPRDGPRDVREPERREESRFERREEDRAPNWTERERELDRPRRDLPPQRPEPRPSNDHANGGLAAYQPPSAPIINPDRLALLESAGADVSVRRPSAPQVPPPREVRRDLPGTPSYLNGRAATTANRYSHGGSSPPTQAPPVPAFTLSFAPTTTAQPPTQTGNHVTRGLKSQPESKPSQEPGEVVQGTTQEPRKASPLAEATHRHDQPNLSARPWATGAERASQPPSSAPKAPRALEHDVSTAPGSRLQGIKSMETLSRSGLQQNSPSVSQVSSAPITQRNSVTAMPASSLMPRSTYAEPQVPRSQELRLVDITAPTGPRASRISPAQIPQASVSPRPPFASPRSDISAPHAPPAMFRRQTPPPTAPSGPRNKSFSVSPKLTTSSVPTAPTAPKAIRGAPLAPRAAERVVPPVGRVVPPWAPPVAPRNSQHQWNQWRRPPVPSYGDRTAPSKRDPEAEEKPKRAEEDAERFYTHQDNATNKAQNGIHDDSDGKSLGNGPRLNLPDGQKSGQDHGASAPGHSAAQNFFGQPLESTERDPEAVETGGGLISSSEEDEPDEGDPQDELALFNAKFERQRRVLEAQLVDLSGREYRATTPLEAIARLTRISAGDLQRFCDQSKMELDVATAAAPSPSIAPQTNSSSSEEGPELSTPKAEDEPMVDVRNSGEHEAPARRMRRLTPEVITLPYLTKRTSHPPDAHLFNRADGIYHLAEPMLLAALREQVKGEEREADTIQYDFGDDFVQWREECEEIDKIRDEMEKQERHQSQEPGPELDALAAAPMNPAFEGRRLHKFSSEYEIEQVIKQSEETARIEQERQDQENRKLKADMEKEALSPDQTFHESFGRFAFVDNNRLRDPKTVTWTYSYEPPVDTFSEDEQRLFVDAFKETPKKWGEIASLLPGHTYKDCIHHYYANKWDGRFRDNRTKKMKASGRARGRGGRGPMRGRGSALMADLGRVDELTTVPNVSESGRPKRAAAPTTFGEREPDLKTSTLGPSPAKRPGPGPRQDTNGDPVSEKGGKRRKIHDKPGRKPVATQPLAALAAAPFMAPQNHYVQNLVAMEELARGQQQFDDASLLASVPLGTLGAPGGDPQTMYAHDSYLPSVSAEDASRSKALGQLQLSKSSASSYWSVPEQTDFAKYIAHFGTDFAAISAHMQTKTHTMIKNHYQRQIDGGGRTELQLAAKDADRRREVGEDMGRPPTPTPIIKRKYDNPPPNGSRPLAANVDAMDIDDTSPPQRAAVMKHASPPQFQIQPRFPPSAQATPVAAHRVVPSPQPSAPLPAPVQVQVPAPARPLQNPHISSVRTHLDNQSEMRSNLPQQATSMFRLANAPETLSRTPSQQASRSFANEPPNAQYILGLQQERDRAQAMQDHEQQRTQQDRMEVLSRQPSFNRGSAQGSPANPPMQMPQERKIQTHDRPLTPGYSSGAAAGSIARPLLGQPSFMPMGAAQFQQSHIGRMRPNASPPKREEPRLSFLPPAPHTRPTSTAAPSAPPPIEPPKRSNLLSILNSEPEEPNPVKRESLPAVNPRISSPVSSMYSKPPTPAPGPSGLSRRETFGQPSLLQSQFRPTFPPNSQTPSSTLPAFKHENASTGHGTQAMKHDWARVLGQSSPAGQQSPPVLEREVRPYFSHNRAAVLGHLNQHPRGIPSPPPIPSMQHARAPSLTTGSQQPPREQHPSMLSQQSQSAPHQSAQPIHPSSYGGQPIHNPFSQSQPQPHPAQGHGHHVSRNSIGTGFPSLHQRALSRENTARHHQEQQVMMAHREREELDWRRGQGVREMEQQHQQQQQQQMGGQYLAHMQQQELEHRNMVFSRGQQPPPPPSSQPPFTNPGFEQARGGMGLREQSLRETEAAMLDQERRVQGQQDAETRRQENHHIREEVEMRRRQDEALYQRRTPLGGGYGHPPPRR